MIICSQSTYKFFEPMDTIRIVNSAPTSGILNKIDTYEDVIAVGGGAVIDTAKILSKKVICFPTTAAGASSTSHSVYWEGNVKKSIKRQVPFRVYILEDFVRGLPDSVKEYTRYDALSHCLDSMWSINKTKKSLHYVNQALEMLSGDLSNTELIRAGNIAGQAIELCPTTILHSLSYPLTGYYGVPHGKALGFLLPTICEYMGFDLKRYVNYSEVKLDNIDFNLIIKEGLKYGKIGNVNIKIDFGEIKKIFIRRAV